MIFHLLIFKAFTNFLSARSLKDVVAKKKLLENHKGPGQGCNPGPSAYSRTSNFDWEANHSYEVPTFLLVQTQPA